MVTNKVNLASLQVKRDNLAEEARIIRRKEEKAKKWIRKSFDAEVCGDNYLKMLQGKGWEVRLLTEEQRQKYKNAKWRHIAHLRKRNRNHNEAVRYSLWEHRTKVVRPEARATHLAIAYMKGVPYEVVETKSKNGAKAYQNLPDLKKIWKIVQKYPLINDESVEDISHLKDWLGSYVMKGPQAG